MFSSLIASALLLTSQLTATQVDCPTLCRVEYSKCMEDSSDLSSQKQCQEDLDDCETQCGSVTETAPVPPGPTRAMALVRDDRPWHCKVVWDLGSSDGTYDGFGSTEVAAFGDAVEKCKFANFAVAEWKAACSRKPKGRTCQIQNPQPSGVNEWELTSGAATDIAAGQDGAIWVTGSNVFSDGGDIYKFDGSNWAQQMAGKGVRIAIDAEGKPWVANNSRQLYRYDGANFAAQHVLAFDVAIGPDNVVWIARHENDAISIFNNKGGPWVKVFVGNNVSVDSNGNPWITSQGQIYRYDGSTFGRVPGLEFPEGSMLFDVAAGANGTAWVIGPQRGIYYWSGTELKRKTGGGHRIAVDRSGTAWLVGTDTRVYKWVGGVP